MYGFLYVREHPSYENACKVGITDNIPDRESTYATGELHRGKFSIVFSIDLESACLKRLKENPMKMIEKRLMDTFQMFHIYYDGGTEFFDKKVMVKLESFLESQSIDYTRLSDDEIDGLTRCKRITNANMIPNEYIKNQLLTPSPRPYQNEIIEKAIDHFERNDKGVLDLICGVGKTLISLWITKGLKCNNFIVGVPNRLLLNQWSQVIHLLFGPIPCLIVSSGIKEQDIVRFLRNKQNNCVVLTTYASSYKVKSATEAISFKFGMNINDEFHHLTSDSLTNESIELNTKKEYIKMLFIESKKRLSLSATLKNIEGEGTISNTDVKYFGNVIDKKGLLWAINEKILCDYVVQTIILKEGHSDALFRHFQIIEDTDKRLFLSAYASLKSISDGNSHHLLIYSNSQLHSLQIIKYINLLLTDGYFGINGLEYSEYHSNLPDKKQIEILNLFENAEYGIMSGVYCLGEGWDFPKLDGVVFAENMTSNIRVVQSALRPSRKNIKEPNKISKIILPILNQDDWTDCNSDFKKVREIIYKMGQQDVSILQKVKAYKIDGRRHLRPSISEKEKDYEFGEYDEEFTKQIRLKTINRTEIGMTYEKSKRIISDNNIKSRSEYRKLCEKDIRLSLDPEMAFQGQFTNWVDYLSIGRLYYELETCKQKVTYYIKKNPELNKLSLNLIEITRILCTMDVLFPPNDLWVDYYKVELDKIIIFSNKKKIGIRI